MLRSVAGGSAPRNDECRKRNETKMEEGEGKGKEMTDEAERRRTERVAKEVEALGVKHKAWAQVVR